jgi:hypothetical protein
MLTRGRNTAEIRVCLGFNVLDLRTSPEVSVVPKKGVGLTLANPAKML